LNGVKIGFSRGADAGAEGAGAAAARASTAEARIDVTAYLRRTG